MTAWRGLPFRRLVGTGRRPDISINRTFGASWEIPRAIARVSNTEEGRAVEAGPRRRRGRSP
ncbi:hypothetical protein ACFCWT_17845, partial [Streptomyces olivaceus]|uniref:hypothetical protein n=1 Tax=Streptomyces olivaceus TaxID=47716 RepID=UPI0035DFBBAE